ncbi:hypothetical protein [Bradyrhizobium erythrophlei]|uniref:hypothetical protein n=1 Tax=Bradyrhizobium erythrophlei TaxID=1437360 RepID=UPI0015C57AE4|nr:hypothetical protein [Bradyrhizobium erythrophlei]
MARPTLGAIAKSLSRHAIDRLAVRANDMQGVGHICSVPTSKHGARSRGGRRRLYRTWRQLVAIPFRSLKLDDPSGHIVLPGANRNTLEKLPVFVGG